MVSILIVANSSDSKKGGVPAFNQRFAVASAAAGHVTYLLIPAQDKTQTLRDIALDHRGVNVAMVPNDKDPEYMRNHEEYLPELLNEYVLTTSYADVTRIPTLRVSTTGQETSSYLPLARSLQQGPDVTVGHARFSGLAPGSIVRGPRRSFEQSHAADKAWYPYSKYVHMVHMEVVRLGEVKGEDAGKRWLKLLLETIPMEDADLVACVGRGTFEWVWGYRDSWAIALPYSTIRARLHEVVPGAEVEKAPGPAPSHDTLKLLIIGRASDTTKDAPGAFAMVRRMAKEPSGQSPAEPYPAHLTVLGMPTGQVSPWQDLADFVTEMPKNIKPEQRMVTVEAYGPPSKVIEEIGKSDAVIIPSLSEAFGLVCFEALQQGKPAIASYNTGFGRFLLDTDRVTEGVGKPFVVLDGDLQGENRIDQWAAHLHDAKKNIIDYYKKTETIQDILHHYTWKDCVNSIVQSSAAGYDSKQVADGGIKAATAPQRPKSVPEEDNWWDI